MNKRIEVAGYGVGRVTAFHKSGSHAKKYSVAFQDGREESVKLLRKKNGGIPFRILDYLAKSGSAAGNSNPFGAILPGGDLTGPDVAAGQATVVSVGGTGSVVGRGGLTKEQLDSELRQVQQQLKRSQEQNQLAKEQWAYERSQLQVERANSSHVDSSRVAVGGFRSAVGAVQTQAQEQWAAEKAWLEQQLEEALANIRAKSATLVSLQQEQKQQQLLLLQQGDPQHQGDHQAETAERERVKALEKQLGDARRDAADLKDKLQSAMKVRQRLRTEKQAMEQSLESLNRQLQEYQVREQTMQHSVDLPAAQLQVT